MQQKMKKVKITIQEDGEPKEIEIEVKKLLETSLNLYSYVDDEEKIKFFENYELNKLWKLAFEANDATKVLQILKDKGITGNKFTDGITRKFISDYNGSKEILKEIPKNYSFHKPNLMQLYVSHKIKTEPHFLNLSGTGAGKTLSAIISSRIINAKMTLTSPGCPVAGTMPRMVELALLTVEGINSVDVNLVWEPPWNKTLMSEVAKLELGME